MDATTIDQEFEQLQAEFQDVAKTVQGLAEKMQAAEQAGDAKASEWLGDLKEVARDIDDEQAQVQKLLLAVHAFVGQVAQAQQAEKPPLYAPGHEPQEEETVQPGQRHHGILGGMLGGGALGGGMLGGLGGGTFGGYYGGGFGQAMEMGMAMNLGANLVSSIFR